MRKRIAEASVISIILLILFADCAQASDSAVSDLPMTFTDSENRLITIHAPVQRIIVLNENAAEAVVILGSGEKVVGAVDQVLEKGGYYPSIKNAVRVGSRTEIDFEKIVKVAEKEDKIYPDIIVLCYTAPDRAYGMGADTVSQKLSAFKNITVIGLNFYEPEKVKSEMLALGKILGKESEAERYVAWYDGEIKKAKSAVLGQDQTTVFFESMGSSGALSDLSTYGGNSAMSQMVNEAGGFSIFQEECESAKVAWEWVAAQSPDVIIKHQPLTAQDGMPGWSMGDSASAKKLKEIRNNILSRPGGTKIPAISNDRVYVLSVDATVGPDLPVGIASIAKILHPEIDIDPDQVYEEYLELLGVSWPEGRTFVYPDVG
ncbi:MAG: corrinoid ABC transporter substrate-binding protein [Methanosaeta sp. PtaB.Bin018]|nr:ABC transporter substrate-binding protein [Methanothrix sp.]OPX74693.1 MAG: corrinoid ABC transporter substrate-binding protein [Methanosaeta sp. PtaB.Bin018]OPY47721.1 MAG: corrinoid ABC transporter substrate-binding protein [Methanosaeta sp. PtaU1.Bin016]